MNKDLEILRSAFIIADIHANHLTFTIEEVRDLFPVDENLIAKLSRKQLYSIDFLINRFARLQDTIGDKVFPAYLNILVEKIENKSVLDRLYMLEKLEIIPSVDFWKDMRRVRNEITHEYPDSFGILAKTINECFERTKDLLIFWKEFREVVIKRVPGVILEK